MKALLKISGRNLKASAGFSLVELITVIVIVSIIAGILARFIIFAMDTYFFVDQRKDLMRETRLAIFFMERDFRQVRSENGVVAATATQFHFYNYDDAEVTYLYENNKIKRNGNTLAGDVTSFQFRYQKADGKYLNLPVTSDSLEFIWNIESEFTIEKGTHSQNMLVLVHPRNY